MSATFDARAQIRPPDEPGSWRAFAFAVLVHLLLVAMLAFGVAWKTRPPETYEVDLWSATPQEATRGEPTPPAPVPPVPDPTPALRQPPPPAVDPAPQQPDPDIALQKARDAAKKKAEADRLAQLERQQQQLLRDEQRRLDDLKRQQDEQKAALDAQKKADAQKRAEDAKAAKQREADFQKSLAAMTAMAGSPGGSANATAAQSAGNKGSPSWKARVIQMIRGNTRFAQTELPGNPEVLFSVKLDPAGGILNLTLVKSSGVPAFDDAVERAIRNTAPFPPDGDHVPADLTVSRRLQEASP